MREKNKIILFVLLVVFIFPLKITLAETNSAGAVVVVNSASESRFDFDRYLKLYLDYFDVAYTVVDIADEGLPADFSRAALLILSHKGVLDGMDVSNQTSIVKYIEAGGGVFSFDMPAKPEKKNIILNDILKFNIDEPVKIQGSAHIKFLDKNHYITAYKIDRPDLKTMETNRYSYTIPNTTEKAHNVKTLVSIADVPLLTTAEFGKGRIVQWSTYEWLNENVLGFYNGLDDIVWRSIVWAARKPFVFQGNIPLVSMRLDDCNGLDMDYAYIDVINKYGITPHIAFMMDDTPPSAAKKLGEYTRTGKAEAFVHSRKMGDTDFMYWDFSLTNFHRGKPLTEERIKQNFEDLDVFHKKYDIKYARSLVAHWGAIDKNVFPYLRKMGVEYVQSLIMIYPSSAVFWENSNPWPYQLYQRPGYYQSVFGFGQYR